MQKILIKQLVNYHKHVKIPGQELGGAAGGSLVNSRWVGSGYGRCMGESVHCAVTGLCLRMRHRPSARRLYRFGRFTELSVESTVSSH